MRHAATKLTIPMSVRPTVARPHLHERLDGGNYQVGVVSAPAGFGKTSLLSTWARANRGIDGVAVVQPSRCRAGAVLGRSLVGGGRSLARGR